MSRRAKPGKAKVEAKPTARPKVPENEGNRVSDLEKRLAEALKREAEALEQQAATAEILRVISSSPTDVQPVFDVIVEEACRLCDAVFANAVRIDGELMHNMAAFGFTPEAQAVVRSSFPMRPSRATMSGRAILERAVVVSEDASIDKVGMTSQEISRSLGARAMVSVPMLRDGIAVGAITLARRERGRIPERQIALLKTFAAQAVIAIENVRLFTETKEALERQTATAEILKVISSSPTDVQPVFDAIAESAFRLLSGAVTGVLLRVGDGFRLVAMHSGDQTVGLPPSPEYVPIDPAANFPSRVFLGRRMLHIPDWSAIDLPVHERGVYESMGVRSSLMLPMLREGNCVGVLFVGRASVRAYTDKEIELLQSFVDQAMIAIENVRLVNETKEALEQQTATAEILRVISASPTDIQPVFDAVLDRALTLCEASHGSLYQLEGGAFRHVAARGTFMIGFAVGEVIPLESAPGRAVLEKRTLHIEDALEDLDWVAPEVQAGVRRTGVRTYVAVPLLREQTAIGAILIRRLEVRPFTDKQIRLLQTFADQAVIAIENVRLFKELEERNRAVTESLERQTAAADILRLIGTSPTDAQPVFNGIARGAVRTLGALGCAVFRVDGDMLHVAAMHNVRPERMERFRSRFPVPLSSIDEFEQTIRDGIFHLVDIEHNPNATPEDVENAHLGGYRTRLMTPMMRANRALGIIAVTREAAGPFAAEQVQLLQTFADQAVIAIENVRLFTELESRNRDLNATSEILQVISRSPTDVQPVLDAVVESAVRLCAAYDARIWQLDGDRLVRAAGNGPMVEESVDWLPLDSAAPSSVAFLERRTVHFDETQWSANERFRDSQRRTGIQSGVATPLMREGQAIGVLAVRRQQPGRFSDKHVALLQTFADQAVIAIENVRLFTELQQKNAALTQAHAQVTEALEQQTATSEILRVISSSPTDEQPVFDAIVQSAGRLCEATFSGVFLAEAGQLTLAAVQGLDAAGVAAAQAAYPRPVARDTTTGRAVMDRRVVHIEDTWLDSEYTHPLRDTIALRSVLTVPIFREGRPIGAVSVWRGEPRPFTDKQIALLQTFADQAVIALENTRLFTELQTSNRELTTALDTQTATSNILRVISGSRTDVQPVFDAIVTSAVRLLRGFVAAMSRIAGDRLELAAFTNSDSAGDAAVRSAFPQLLDSDWPHSRVVRDRVVLNVTDARSDPQLPEAIRNVAVVRGYQSLVVLPMVRHDDAVGAISVTRREPGGFTVDEIALLQTFADQAVIAIENARLLTELQQRNEALTQAHAQVTEALEQQTATSEILRVISRSPGDVQPVFDAIAANAARLCDAVNGLVIRFDGRLLHLAAHYNVDPERLAAVRQSYPRPPSRGALSGRAVLMRAVVHVPDVSKDPEYTLPMATTIGYRSVLAVPMMRDDVVHGTILVARGHVAPFSDTHITLIQTFADQAVIAIENVRLFTELQASNRDLTTALDTQTATSDILRVISRSQTDVQPVFQAIVDSAQRLLQGNSSVMSRIVGDRIELAAYTRTGATADALLGSFFPMPLNAPGSDARPIRKIVIGGRVPYNVADTERDERVGERGRTNARARGYRSQLVIPMLRHDEAIGTIAVTRREPGGFTDDEIALLQTFADQAVIAIENARLLNELQARTEDLTRSVGELRALGEVGQAISSTLDLETVLRTIVARATQLADADAGVIYEYDEQREVFEPRATERLEDDIVQTLVATPVRKGQGATGRLAEVREPIQLADVRAPGEQLPVRDALIRAGYRALLAVPLVREDHLIGGLTVFRKTPGAFAAAIVDLLKTFATQSSLAIQNARLFREIAQKSRELEVASQHKSEFLASMSHELRTPLNAIIGFSDVLLQGMFGEMSDKQTEYLQDILASGQHLLSLINDILDLSKIEAGRMELDLADFDLPTAVDDALLLMRERAGRRGITLERHVDERVGEISGDQRKVKQVLLNLLSNAVKFTPEGGRIDVRAALADGMAEISVTDTGVGIAPEDHDAVFEEFRQVGKADKKAEGTGLGLALCRKFVELHGGRIWVKSKIGAGSTFTFTLPLSR